MLTRKWIFVAGIVAFSAVGPVIAQTENGGEELSGGSGCGKTPSSWVSLDVGAVGLAGSSCYANGVLTIRGAGADIYDLADSFHFTYQPLTGDGHIIARVTSEQDTHVYARAGVMIRQSLTAGSPHVILDILPGHGIEVMTRENADKMTRFVAAASLSFPAWLRLDRSGSTVMASISSDGTTWTSVVSTSISMPPNVYIGLAVSSRDIAALNTAMFDHVTVP